MADRMPYREFDMLPDAPLRIENAVLDIRFASGELTLSHEAVLAWLTASARAVSIYYGRFPASKPRILIVPVAGHGVQKAQAFGYRGPAIRLMVGADTTEADLKDDWKAVHEMIHLALPDVGDEHLWLSEGLAVYVESIARVQAGDLTEQKIWSDFVRDMPKGLPAPGDQGLDFTHTWGRTYWGGAIFCLLADVELRRLTNNKIGLQQAMRGVLNAGGTHDQDWPIERVLELADNATGTHVMARLYDKMRADPVSPDLTLLWEQLGVARKDGAVALDSAAPLAAVRNAIVSMQR